MGIELFRMRAAALAALAWGSACGGNVVVDGMPDGSGGAGATSSSANTTGAFGSSAVTAGVGGSSVVTAGVGGMGTSGTGISTGTGGGDDWSMCVAFCERYDEQCGRLPPGFLPGDCGVSCDALLGEAPECNELLTAFHECEKADEFDCDVIRFRCQPLKDKYSECALGSKGCWALECVNNRDRSCSCRGSCLNLIFEVECRPDGANAITCSCRIEDELVGTCQDVSPACDPTHGCCVPIFEQIR